MSTPVESPAARDRVEAVLSLIVALIDSGYPTVEAFALGTRAARGLGIGDALLIDGGNTIGVQWVTADGEVIARTALASGLGGLNCRNMRQLSALGKEAAAGRLDPKSLISELADLAARPGPQWWVTTAGMSLLAFAIGLQVGIGVVPSLTIAVVQAFVTPLGVIGGRYAVQRVFLCGAQTIAAGLLMALAHLIGVVTWFQATTAIGVPWLLVVPLPILIGMVVDAVNEYPQAAVARLFVVALGGGGVALGVFAVMSLGTHLDGATPSSFDLPSLPIALGMFFSVVGAIANALANGGARHLLFPATVVALVTAGVNQFLLHVVGFTPSWSIICASVVLGLVSAVWSTHSSYPITVLALLGITGAILPGLTVYVGIAKTVFGEAGAADFGQAALTGVGIGVGVAFGALLATARERS
ncbi:MAG: threonine/serine exporter family protein [Gordonia sp. (in: high G+C Gram-positive bacteria)]